MSERAHPSKPPIGCPPGFDVLLDAAAAAEEHTLLFLDLHVRALLKRLRAHSEVLDQIEDVQAVERQLAALRQEKEQLESELAAARRANEDALNAELVAARKAHEDALNAELAAAKQKAEDELAAFKRQAEEQLASEYAARRQEAEAQPTGESAARRHEAEGGSPKRKREARPGPVAAERAKPAKRRKSSDATNRLLQAFNALYKSPDKYVARFMQEVVAPSIVNEGAEALAHVKAQRRNWLRQNGGQAAVQSILPLWKPKIVPLLRKAAVLAQLVRR